MSVLSFPSTPALAAFLRDTDGLTAEARRSAFFALPEDQRDIISAEKRAANYLPKRGLSAAAIERHGLRVERVGSRARKYGFGEQSDDAANAWALVIPYAGNAHHPPFERLRLIDPADLERLGGGKYRTPYGREAELFDPCDWLGRGPDAGLLVEGEMNALSVVDLLPTLPTFGLPGKLTLRPRLAAQLAGLSTAYVWIDRTDKDPKGFGAALARIGRTLHGAGVPVVLVIPSTGKANPDANDILRTLGRDLAAQRLQELLEGARLRGPYTPPPEKAPPPRKRKRSTVASDGLRDAIKEVPADEWVLALLDVEVPGSRKIRCPLHEERTASCHVYRDHLHCHGCGAHLYVFDLAAHLWDRDTRNSDHFKELLQRLADRLGIRTDRGVAA